MYSERFLRGEKVNPRRSGYIATKLREFLLHSIERRRREEDKRKRDDRRRKTGDTYIQKQDQCRVEETKAAVRTSHD